MSNEDEATAERTGLGLALLVIQAVPGVGQVFAAIVGAMMALAAKLQTSSTYAVVAATPADAAALLAMIHVDPAYLFRLNEFAQTLGLRGWESYPTLAPADRAAWAANSPQLFTHIGGAGATALPAALYTVRALRLLAGLVPGASFAGPVTYPIVVQPAYFSDPAALAYMQAGDEANHGSDFNPAAGQFAWTPGTDPNDPFTDLGMLAYAYRRYLLGAPDAPPIIRSAAEARTALGVLRATLPRADLRLRVMQTPGGATTFSASDTETSMAVLGVGPELAGEIRALRRMADETGPDPVLAPIVGDVTVSGGVSAPGSAPSLFADGTLIRSGSAPTIYVVQGGQRRPIPDPGTLVALGYDPSPETAWVLADAALAAVPAGPPATIASVASLLSEGDLVKGVGDPIYVVQGGQKRWVPDPAALASLGLAGRPVRVLSDAALAAVPTGPAVPRGAQSLLQGLAANAFAPAGSLPAAAGNRWLSPVRLVPAAFAGAAIAAAAVGLLADRYTTRYYAVTLADGRLVGTYARGVREATRWAWREYGQAAAAVEAVDPPATPARPPATGDSVAETRRLGAVARFREALRPPGRRS